MATKAIIKVKTNGSINKSDASIESFMKKIIAKNPGEPEFHQAVFEVAETVIPFIEKYPEYKKAKILERIAEPERVIMFRVPWMDDKGDFQINRGFRIQMNSAIGPYKGGLRFHPTVYLGILKFLAFEQVFKNSLTTLPMGGGKRGRARPVQARPRGSPDTRGRCRVDLTSQAGRSGQRPPARRAVKRPSSDVTRSGRPKQDDSDASVSTPGSAPAATTRPPRISSACVKPAGISST